VHGGAFEATVALAPGDRLVASIDVHARQVVAAEGVLADAVVRPPDPVLSLDPGAATGGPDGSGSNGSGTGSLAADRAAEGVRCLARRIEPDGVSLPQARRIVSGGRGLGGAEGFAVLSRLADALDAQLGASRPPCDAGWVPAHHQVGITGARVAPELYVAVGISGSVQHLAGMRAAQRIVAINRDPSAPIFGYADLGVVGDWQEVVAGMLDELDTPVLVEGAVS
jgi:electron transfer flavoprotein alpha subunit